MPLQFAVTLFVSATLLFMVQPMIGKLVLPLLGGSPAVWNACMVFFQSILLLGYFYADRLTRHPSIRKQWYIHIGVMSLPIAVFVLAILFDGRPLAIAESLAPTEGSSPILSVLAILTVAIGIPFFVVSTSATLLQKWFTYTGHPSARDPYFLYAASNLGSLISLLGYPIFIEPNMTQGAQTWFWAFGFVALFGLIAYCGRAAVNPLGVPPGARFATATATGGNAAGGRGGHKQTRIGSGGSGSNTAPPVVNTEPPPSWLRMAKWTLLAFVPSSLMLGVTFHMTTDIASIPLLWVGPLALYLITFIIAFGRTPPWFRILIGNLAPVMILLLVFVMISEQAGGFSLDLPVGIKLLLHLLTFFAAAMMCHYELALDRPKPQYLTTYFLIMSFGGVCGGIFNALIAPVIFSHTYEYPIALIIACLMVPKLLPGIEDDEQPVSGGQPEQPKAPWLGKYADETDFWPMVIGVALIAALSLLVSTPVYSFSISLLAKAAAVVGYVVLYLFVYKPLYPLYRKQPAQFRRRVALALDIIIPVLLGLAFWQLQKLPVTSTWFASWLTGIAEAFPKLAFMSPKTLVIVTVFAVPVMICFFFVDRPLRFALAVAAVLGPKFYKDHSGGVLYTERTFFGILKIEEEHRHQPLADRTNWHIISDDTLKELRNAKIPDEVLQKLMPLKDKEIAKHDLQRELASKLTPDELSRLEGQILKSTLIRINTADQPVKWEDGSPMILGKYEFRRLVHGTTLHGTQVWKHERHLFDDLQLLTAMNPLENIAVMGTIQNFDMRQEPLTYYHRTGPVGAMFAELQRQGKEKEPVAMIGLGTGSVSCYAQKGQKLTYYEIDPAVKRLVADTDQYFTYVEDARKRGAEIDFRMGDARLVLKQDVDRKYALLLVDAFSSDSIPVHLLTVEAVGLYLDRLTEDGILALHISNKFVKLEPVVAAIAEKHGLVARMWSDDSEAKLGKTASSWVVLAREPEHLGDRLCSPISNYTKEFYTSDTLLEIIQSKYPAIRSVMEKARANYREAMLKWLDDRKDDPQAQLFASWLRKYGSEVTSLMTIIQGETGYGFRTLVHLTGPNGVDAWTDDYADVMRVMMIRELQAVRGFFGLPTPVKR